MTDISVVIVSFNSREFLKNSIKSVFKAASNVSVEVIVVDNNSGDGTVKMLRDQFPNIKCIGNNENRGYSAACNQGIELAQSPYILILNPDTLLREDCLEKCLQFARGEPELGALGVKMYDGTGKYLPESKRGFPFPLSALWKITGINKVFPGSSVFNHYYLGHLSENERQEIDVLTGAFMFIPKAVLDKTGFFDEEFFMYGEDIDLSYRIQKAGFKIFYIPDTCIIHYKGVSTQRGSFRYVRHFYRAMLLFAKKHFSREKYRWALIIINMAIYLRAALSFFKRILTRLFKPVLELAIFYFGMIEIKELWAIYYFKDPGYYNQSPILLNLAGCAVIYVTSIAFHSGYKYYLDLARLARSILWGLVLILILYALLPSEWRSSRAMILFGSIWFLISGMVLRYMAATIRNVWGLRGDDGRPRKIILIGIGKEIVRIQNEIHAKDIPIQILHTVRYDPDEKETFEEYIGKLVEGYSGYPIDDVLICLKKFPSSELFRIMTLIGGKATIRVVGSDSLNIIGSSSRTGPGYLYSLEMQFEISKTPNKILKTLFDVLGSLFLLLGSPVLSLKLRIPFKKLVRSLIEVLLRRKSLVGYIHPDPKLRDLPEIKDGIFNPFANPRQVISDKELIHKINIDYAMNYSVWKDFIILLKHIF